MSPDKNVSDPTSSYQWPQKTDSFFDAYRDGNSTNGGAGQKATPGAATGGFCTIAGAEGRRAGLALVVGFGLAAAALTRARRRRRP